MPDPAAQPIIIVKKKSGGHGHHGGAWKVAYADFVTAMMALFMVMWLMNSSDKVKQAVAGYFQDPSGYGKKMGSGAAGLGDSLTVGKSDMGQLKDQLTNAMSQMPEFQALKDHVAMTVTGEGLRVELMETEQGFFFESGHYQPSAMGEELLMMMAKELGALPNDILIEGHTDAKPFQGQNGYSNWELSTDRANAARKLMESSGLRPGQVVQVRGFADRRLRSPDSPHDPANRRVSVIVQYSHRGDAEQAQAAEAEPLQPGTNAGGH